MEGAHKLLNIIANDQNNVTLRMSAHSFEGADVREQMELCEATRGGEFTGWRCSIEKLLTLFIFICDIVSNLLFPTDYGS